MHDTHAITGLFPRHLHKIKERERAPPPDPSYNLAYARCCIDRPARNPKRASTTVGSTAGTVRTSRMTCLPYCCAWEAGGWPMHAQNADEIRRRRRARLSCGVPSLDGDCRLWVVSGLSGMSAAAAAAAPRRKELDDAARGERSPARLASASGAAVVDGPLRSRLLNGSSQMRPDEPCRRNDTADL